jgi:maltose/moltooligosaccharide transporter
VHQEVANATPDSAPPPEDKRYTVGTLRYSKRGLVALFFFLLWGDFCFYFMEQLIPSIMPLKLASLDASNLTITTLTSTIYYLMNMVVNPIVSFRSDRFRSRFGRRRPFLLLATPFVTLMLVLLGYSEDIGHALAGWGGWFGLSANATTVLVIGVLLVFFQFFNLIIYAVYFYLFNDVVPEALLGRFIGLFRIVSHTASFLFSLLVFPHAMTHMRMIFVGAALLYFSGFMLMCWRVREGEYPPPPPLDEARTPLLAAVKTYFRECFTIRLFLYFFAFMALMQASWAVNPFYNLFLLSIGLSMEQIGHYNAWLYIPGIILLYPAGIVTDRIGPQRGYLAIMPFYLLYALASYFLVRDFQSWIWVAIFYLPLNAMRGVVEGTMAYSTLPRQRFGQFASANALVSSLVAASAGVVAGAFMDLFKRWYGAEDYYRLIFLWMLTFWTLAAGVLVLLYREWRRVQALQKLPDVHDASDAADVVVDVADEKSR